ncbi:hypothetical protein QWY79_06775 [Halomonas sabkhae]|uniref:hypothetical protein n=1 Tax=Halomonas sabkhae TaxID=626223 RepID=UPI0025B431E7|nr:hypothetical protein [Halomonas sabkhae]MDN3524973.1 hypothetical protein [Halomonas sabkhae]
MEEMLKNSPSIVKRKAHGAQKARHNYWLGELSSTAQRSDLHAQAFKQRFLEDAGTFTADRSVDHA